MMGTKSSKWSTQKRWERVFAMTYVIFFFLKLGLQGSTVVSGPIDNRSGSWWPYGLTFAVEFIYGTFIFLGAFISAIVIADYPTSVWIGQLFGVEMKPAKWDNSWLGPISLVSELRGPSFHRRLTNTQHPRLIISSLLADHRKHCQKLSERCQKRDWQMDLLYAFSWSSSPKLIPVDASVWPKYLVTRNLLRPDGVRVKFVHTLTLCGTTIDWWSGTNGTIHYGVWASIQMSILVIK